MDGHGVILTNGKPTIYLTPRALTHIDQAVYTVGHEIGHIRDSRLGVTLTEPAANAHGSAYLAKFLKHRRH